MPELLEPFTRAFSGHYGRMQGSLSAEQLALSPFSDEPSLPEIRWRSTGDTLFCLASALRGIPLTFAQNGETPFIHSTLYEDRASRQIQAARALCCCYISSAGRTSANIISTIGAQLNELVNDHQKVYSFSERLAFVQALMIYAILCLFNDDLRLRSLGERCYGLLGRWTMKLWQQVPTHLPTDLNVWEAWVFAESVRRTILVSHLIRGVYASIKQGYHSHTLFLEALPFDAHTDLWNRSFPKQSIKSNSTSATNLVTYREYVAAYVQGKTRPAGMFERLLLTACLGANAFAVA